MTTPNGKPPQKTTSKTPEQLNIPFSQTYSWMNGKRTEYIVHDTTMKGEPTIYSIALKEKKKAQIIVFCVF